VTHGHDATCTDLPSESGIGVCIRSIDHGPGQMVSGETFDRHPAGFIIAHDVPGGGERCEGALTIDEAHFGPERWTVSGSLEAGDLTLTPSVACTVHPTFHAHVTNGRWTG